MPDSCKPGRRLDRRGFVLLLAAGALAACSSSTNTTTASPGSPGSPTGGAATSSPTAPTAPTAPSRGPSGPSVGAVSVIAANLDVPWGVSFLPSGDAVGTERETGRVLSIPKGGGAPKELITLPGVDTDGTSEGGLLGVAVSPSYSTDGLLYAYYTSATDNRIVRFKAGAASSVKPILTGLKRGAIHNGGRIAFGPDGKLYAGVGETGERGLAQDLSSPNGKILRVNADGSIPPDNPFKNSPVWSYGHRNVQGFAWDSSDRMWGVEFGQDRFDEVNLIEPGRQLRLAERRGRRRHRRREVHQSQGHLAYG